MNILEDEPDTDSPRSNLADWQQNNTRDLNPDATTAIGALMQLLATNCAVVHKVSGDAIAKIAQYAIVGREVVDEIVKRREAKP